MALVVMIAATVFAFLGAYAENEVTCISSVNPNTFFQSGKAVLTVQLKNSTDFTAENITVSFGENRLSETAASIAPHDEAQFEFSVDVTDKMLTAGKADISVAYTLNRHPYQKQISVPVQKQAELTQLEISRYSSSSCVREGDTLLLTYFCRNTGNVALEQIVVCDLLDNYAFPPFDLAPNETMELHRTWTADRTCISRISATCTSVLSGKQHTQITDEFSVTLRTDNVRVKVEESSEIIEGERGEILVTVENAGAFRYHSLSMYEDTVGEIPFLPAALGAGESFSLCVKTPPMYESREFTFLLSMSDENGNAVRFQSTPVKVSVITAVPSQPSLSASFAEDSENAFWITVFPGGNTLENATIGEKTLGTLRTLALVPAEKKTTVFLPVDAASLPEYTFYLTCSTENGEETMYADAVPAAVSCVQSGSNARTESFLFSLTQNTGLMYTVLHICFALFGAFAVFVLTKNVARKKHSHAAHAQTETKGES